MLNVIHSFPSYMIIQTHDLLTMEYVLRQLSKCRTAPRQYPHVPVCGREATDTILYLSDITQHSQSMRISGQNLNQSLHQCWSLWRIDRISLHVQNSHNRHKVQPWFRVAIRKLVAHLFTINQGWTSNLWQQHCYCHWCDSVNKEAVR